MSEIEERSKKIAQDFSRLHSWQQKYKKIIQEGREASSFDEKYRTKDWLVKGCQSQVWLHARQDEKGRVIFQADSDALITKGLIVLLIQYYSNLLPKDILNHLVPDFFEVLDLKRHLTPTRVGGLFNMIRQIQYYSQGFLYLSQEKSKKIEGML